MAALGTLGGLGSLGGLPASGFGAPETSDAVPTGPYQRQKTVYDGRNMRAAVRRHPVDAGGSLVYLLEKRPFIRDYRDLEEVQPHSKYLRYTMPSMLPQCKLGSYLTTRFVHTSVNKAPCPVNQIVWTPQGRRCITGNSMGEFTLWNGVAFNFETILQAHEHPVSVMQWSHSQNWLVTADRSGVVKYWQPNMGNVMAFTAHSSVLHCLSMAPSDLKFVTGSDDLSLRIWDFKTQKMEAELKGHNWDVRTCDWHPQKALIVSGGKDNLVKFWDPRTGSAVSTLYAHKNAILSTSWNDNGTWLLTTSRDQTIKIFDVRKLSAELHGMAAYKREVTATAWHPSRETLFATGGYTGIICYYVVGNEEPAAVIEQAHQGAVWDMRWHPLGHVLASSSQDTTCKFWCRNRPGDTFRNIYVGQRGPYDAPPDLLAEAGINIAGMMSAIGGAGSGAAAGSSQPLSVGDIGSLHSGFAAGVAVGAAGTALAPAPRHGPQSRRPPPEGYICKKCNEPGHFIQDCPYNNLNGIPGGAGGAGRRPMSDGGHGGPGGPGGHKPPPPSYICNKCHQPGHWIQDCPERKQSVPPDTYTCHLCGQKGHWRQECPQAPSRPAMPLSGMYGGGGPRGMKRSHDDL